MDELNPAAALFDKRAKEYQERFMDVSLYHDSFDLFCELIAGQNAELLELACGPGNITKYLLSKRPDLNVLGTDLAPAMIELAKINNPAAAFQLMDCRAISQIEKQYDAIMCGFCLPYLTREEAVKLIADAAQLLKAGGVFYLSTMEDEYSKSGIQTSSQGDKLYMYFHEADYLVKALEENNFGIVALQRKEYPGANETITKDLLIVARRETAL